MLQRVDYHSSTGSRLSALQWGGSGPDFLLVHGLSSNAATWTMVGDDLAGRGARVVAVDQRSHGRSEVVSGGYDFATYVADLLAVIQQAGLRGPVVAGQSWGGNVVVELAAQAPAAVTAVVGVDGGHIDLAGAFPRWEDCARQLAPPRMTPAPIADIARRIRSMHPDWPEGSIEGTLGNFRIDATGLASPALPFDQHMLILESLWAHRPSEALRRVVAPTRLLAATGSGGPGTDGAAGKGFDDVVLIRGDHDLHAQQPARVARHIAEMTTWES